MTSILCHLFEKAFPRWSCKLDEDQPDEIRSLDEGECSTLSFSFQVVCSDSEVFSSNRLFADQPRRSDVHFRSFAVTRGENGFYGSLESEPHAESSPILPNPRTCTLAWKGRPSSPSIDLEMGSPARKRSVREKMPAAVDGSGILPVNKKSIGNGAKLSSSSCVETSPSMLKKKAPAFSTWLHWRGSNDGSSCEELHGLEIGRL